ncbi:hypothetical protein ACH4OT_27265 [Streptomyces murinus]|uniref:hypothetical protein n=1 Tax=Streptomyces murinus TaxID=33900 RepID=UPI0037A17B29
MPGELERDGAEKRPLSQARSQKGMADQDRGNVSRPPLVGGVEEESSGPAVQVPQYGGPGHRPVGIAEDPYERVGLVRVTDLPQLVEVGGEPDVLIRFPHDVVDVHMGAADTPDAPGARSDRAAARRARLPCRT